MIMFPNNINISTVKYHKNVHWGILNYKYISKKISAFHKQARNRKRSFSNKLFIITYSLITSYTKVFQMLTQK